MSIQLPLRVSTPNIDFETSEAITLQESSSGVIGDQGMFENTEWWRNSIILSEKDRFLYAGLPDEAIEMLVGIFEQIGLDAAQTIVRSAYLSVNKTFNHLFQTVKDTIESPRVANAVDWRKEAIETINYCNRMLKREPTSFNRGIDADNIQFELKDLLKRGVDELRKKDESLSGRASVLIYTETLSAILNVYEVAIYRFLRLNEQKKRENSIVDVIQLTEHYRLAMCDIEQTGLLETLPSFHAQIRKLINICSQHITQMYRSLGDQAVHPMLVAPPSQKLSRYPVGGVDLSVIPQPPFASILDMLQTMKASVHLALGSIALRKGERFALNYLPKELQNICKRIEQLDRHFEASDADSANRPKLLYVKQEPIDPGNGMNMRIVYGYPVADCHAGFSILTGIKDGRPAYLEFDGLFTGFDLNDSLQREKANELLLYAITTCYARSDERMIKPAEFHFKATPGSVHFRWVIPFDENHAGMVSLLELHVRRMIDYIKEGAHLPVYDSSGILARHPSLAGLFLNSKRGLFTPFAALFYLRGLYKYSTKENVEFFLQNQKAILKGVDISNEDLRHIFTDLALLDYVWEEPLLPHYLGFLLKMHPEVANKHPDGIENLQFMDLLDESWEFFKEHFYDIVALGNTTADPETLNNCRDVLELFYFKIKVSEEIIKNFDKRIKEMNRSLGGH